MKSALTLFKQCGKYGLPGPTVSAFADLSFGEAVAVINHIAGNRVDDAQDALLRQLEIIQSEVDELRESILTGNIEGIRDDIADIKFTAEGMAFRVGMTGTDQDEFDVVLSNLTKFDTNLVNAQKTAAKYAKKGIRTLTTVCKVPVTGDVTRLLAQSIPDHIPTYPLYVTVSAEDQYVNGKHYPGGKWLKSHLFVEPKYSDTVKLPTLAK